MKSGAKIVILIVSLVSFASRAGAFAIGLDYDELLATPMQTDDEDALFSSGKGSCHGAGVETLFSLVGRKAEILGGVFAHQRSFDITGDDDVNDLKYGGTVYGPTLRITLNLKRLRPFFQASYVMGRYDLTGAFVNGEKIDFKISQNVSGQMLALGLDMAVGKHLGLVAAALYGQETLKLASSEFKTDGTASVEPLISLAKRSVFRMAGVTLGVELLFH